MYSIPSSPTQSSETTRGRWGGKITVDNYKETFFLSQQSSFMYKLTAVGATGRNPV